MENPDMEREVHNLRARMEDMETSQRCGVGVGDLSDSEFEEEDGHEEGEVTAKDASNERLIKAISRMGARKKWTFQFTRGI
jgi:hypothetical protein